MVYVNGSGNRTLVRPDGLARTIQLGVWCSQEDISHSTMSRLLVCYWNYLEALREGLFIYPTWLKCRLYYHSGKMRPVDLETTVTEKIIVTAPKRRGHATVS